MHPEPFNQPNLNHPNFEEVVKELSGFVIYPGSNSLLSLPIQLIDEVYKIKATSQTPPQQIVINGQAQAIPGREVRHEVRFEPRDGGCVMNENEEVEREFFIIKITTLQNEQIQQEIEVAIYYDEDIKSQIKEVFTQN